MALENHNFSLEFYLDLHTGEILPQTDDIEDLSENPEGYRRIEGLPSSEGYRIMQSFVEGLPPGKAKEELERALQQKCPFSRFKGSMSRYPQLKDAWFEHYYSEWQELMEDWLENEGLAAKLVRPSAQHKAEE